MMTDSRIANHVILTKKEKGQSLVELAVGFTILMVLLAGIVDLGRVLFYNVSLRDAAEEGVHFGSLNPALTSDIEDHVRSVLDPSVVVIISYGPDGDIAPANACSGDRITIEVNQPNFELSMPFIGALLGSQHISLTNVYSGVVLRPSCP